MYINFIDFKKAIDSISREVLWRLLRPYRIPVKMIIIIRALFVGFSGQVVHSGQKTKPLNMRTGVTQGCLLSPLLLLAAFYWVTRTTFTRSCGILWSFTTSFKGLDFADDLALLSQRVQDLRDKIQVLKKQGANVGLKFNAPRTKMMRIYIPNAVISLFIEGEQVEEV